MAPLARWCFGHRRKVPAAWLLALAALAGISVAAGTSFTTNLSLPGTDSQAAVTLLTTSFPAAAGEGDLVVIQARPGATIGSAPVRAAVTGALAKVARVPGVQAVARPYAAGGAAQSADGPDVHISLSGPAITNSERTGLGGSAGVGVAAALAVLLIVFGGALLAALLPLAAALLALAVGTSLIGLLSHVFGIASVAAQFAVLIAWVLGWTMACSSSAGTAAR